MSTVLSLPKKILHSRIFSFLCIRLYISGKEDSNERNPSGVSFVFIQVGLSKNEVFRQAGHRARMSTVLFLYTIAVLKMNTIFCLSCKNKKISERKIVTKETHQGCLSFLFRSTCRKALLFRQVEH